MNAQKLITIEELRERFPELNHFIGLNRLIVNVWHVKEIIDKDDDFIIAIIGRERSGKSTLAFSILIIYLIFKGMNLKEIHEKIKEYLSYTYDDFLKKLSDPPFGNLQLFDETENIAFNRDAMGKQTRKFVQIIANVAGKNFLSIMCIPNTSILDTYIRKSRLDVILYVKQRGIYECYIPRRKFNSDTQEMEFIWPKYANYFERFPDLSNKKGEIGSIWSVYTKLKDQNMKDRIEEQRDQMDTEMKKNKWIDTSQVCTLLGIHRNTLDSWRNKGEIPQEMAQKIGNKWIYDPLWVDMKLSVLMKT